MRRLFIGILAIASLTGYPTNVMASDLMQGDRLDLTPSNTLIAKGLRIPKVGHTNASSQLRKFKPLRFPLGGVTFHAGKNDMRQIITKHTRGAYNRKHRPTKETLFGKRATAKSLGRKISGIFKLHGKNIRTNYREGRARTATYPYKGKNYEIGYDKNRRIRHFYPK
jgi:hypothetical protein